LPTLNQLAPRLLEDYAGANRQKPSGIAAKETIIRVHLMPRLGTKRLDAITTEDVQRLKSQLRHRAVKTLNNVLTVLNTLLKNLQAVGVHVLRHTFCSHLAMSGAPARAIQELAGHRDLSTTQRYMHLSPAALEGAIRLLDQRPSLPRRGDMVETGNAAAENANR